jgi:C1A family cysteine protease
MNQHKYGWKKQVHDPRDLKLCHLSQVRTLAVSLPSTASLLQWCSPVEDQGDLGSCTAHAWAGILQYNENKYPIPEREYFDMSRLFIYYNERVINNTIDVDSGAQLRDGAKVINQYGCCNEVEWPYDTTKFMNKPTDQCYIDALPYRITNYYSLNTLSDMKACIAAGRCFVFGFSVYESFESNIVASTGIMPMPNLMTESLLGGHAVMACAYRDDTQQFLIRNSWGSDWGINGYFQMPYAFISNPNMASDMWTVFNGEI